jgi:hypothetical protein
MCTVMVLTHNFYFWKLILTKEALILKFRLVKSKTVLYIPLSLNYIPKKRNYRFLNCIALIHVGMNRPVCNFYYFYVYLYYYWWLLINGRNSQKKRIEGKLIWCILVSNFIIHTRKRPTPSNLFGCSTMHLRRRRAGWKQDKIVFRGGKHLLSSSPYKLPTIHLTV